MKQKLHYIVSRGKRAGTVLVPHRYENGHFQAHKTNSRNDPEGKRVRTEAELLDLVRLGYHVRMSNPAAGHAPSTVKPEIVHAWSALPSGLDALNEGRYFLAEGESDGRVDASCQQFRLPGVECADV